MAPDFSHDGSGAVEAATAQLDADAIRSLNELVGDDPEIIAELVDAFLEEAPQRLDELQRGILEHDDALTERAAHTLKANGLTFGAVRLGELCKELEVVARTGDVEDAKPLAELVAAEWERVRPALVELRARDAE